MKAVVYTEYGTPDVLKVKQIAKPTPKEGEVLVKVHATSLNMADWYMLSGSPFLIRLEYGMSKPKNPILGFDIAGRVEAVGSAVTQFKVGDEVFGDLSGCGGGGLAEYVSVPQATIALKPANLTFEQAAAVPMAAVTALQGLRQGKLKAGQKVLINGASGGVGTFAVQIAKVLGAEVTAVCSTRNVEQVRALGADHVIDYKREDFTKSDKQYDLIIAANGYHPLSAYRRALKPDGVYVVTGGAMKQIFQAMLLGSVVTLGSQQKVSNLMAKPNQADLMIVKELIEACKVTPVIDSCYPLEQASDALQYLGDGHARGKVVVVQ